MSIEDVIDALSSQCDGARSRDGKGFSRADAQEGGRLSALKRRSMAWSPEDARKAMEITARYARQAGDILGDGRDAKAQGIERSLRAGKVRCADPLDPAQPPYDYACFSPGGRRVLLWRMVRPRDPDGLRRDLGEVARLRHGARRTRVDFDVAADMSRNGAKLRARRSEIDFNGSSRDAILRIADKHGFVLEPAVEAPVDREIDALRLCERAAWIHSGHRDGAKGEWAVFDLAVRHDPFSAAVKRHAVDAAGGGRLYTCDPRDDWNWYVAWDGRTKALVRRLVAHFGFAGCRRILAG